MNFIVKALLRDDFFNVNRAEFFYVHYITGFGMFLHRFERVSANYCTIMYVLQL